MNIQISRYKTLQFNRGVEEASNVVSGATFLKKCLIKTDSEKYKNE